MKTLLEKGYTITVTSWENDADYYATNSKTVETREEVEALWRLMQLCVSKNNKPKGVVRLGNTHDSFSEAQIELLANFFKDNPILLSEPLESKESMDEDKWEGYISDIFQGVVDGLLGSSEYFTCRVMESCDVVYSPQDVKIEEIKFKK